MAQGEKTWNSGSVAAQGQKKAAPLPAKEWDLKLKTDRAEIRRSNEGKFRVTFYAEALDSAEEGQDRNRGIYVDLYCGLNMAGRTDGIKGLADGIGTQLEAEILSATVTDANGNEVEYEYLDPQAVLQFVKQFNGTIVRAKTKVESDKSGKYGDKARIQYFIPTE